MQARALTSVLVDLVQRVLGHREHAHVRAEFLDERLDDRLRGRVRCHPNALGRHLLAAVLEVEAHHAVELEVLQINDYCILPRLRAAPPD